MLSNITDAFYRKLRTASRQPVLLMHLQTSVGVYHLSDRKITKNKVLSFPAAGPEPPSNQLLNEYKPWIEDWGALKDSVNIQELYQGSSLEIRSTTISLIYNHETKKFINEFFKLGIENTLVEIYLWFPGLGDDDKVLIDVFVCQDPISVSERSMIFKMDIVSVLMASNSTLWDRKPGYEYHDIIVGKVANIPLIDLQTARWTTIAEDLDAAFIGPVLIDNGIGFPGSGTVYINSEKVSYDSITATELNITGRGLDGTTARIHPRYSRITIPGAAYDYIACTGPVQTIDNLKADGGDYQNSYTAITNVDPAIVRFYDRPPWTNASVTPIPPEQPPDETLDTFGSGYETYFNNAPDVKDPWNINAPSGVADMTKTFPYPELFGLYWAEERYPSDLPSIVNPWNVLTEEGVAIMNFSATVGERTLTISQSVITPYNLTEEHLNPNTALLGAVNTDEGGYLKTLLSSDGSNYTADGVYGNLLFMPAGTDRPGSFISSEVSFHTRGNTLSFVNVTLGFNRKSPNGVEETYCMDAEDSYMGPGIFDCSNLHIPLVAASWDDFYSSQMIMWMTNNALNPSYQAHSPYAICEIDRVDWTVRYASDDLESPKEILWATCGHWPGVNVITGAKATIKFGIWPTEATVQVVIYTKRNDTGETFAVWSNTYYAAEDNIVVESELSWFITDDNTLYNNAIGIEVTILNSGVPSHAQSVEVHVNWVKWLYDYDTSWATQEVVSHYNQDLSSYGTLKSATALVTLSASMSNVNANVDIVKRTTNNPGDNTTLYSRQLPPGLLETETWSIDANIASFAELINTRVGLRYTTTGGSAFDNQSRQTVIYVYQIVWRLVYAPNPIERPDEEYIIYATDMTCDVTSVIGENPTPAQMIEHLIKQHSPCSAYVDEQNFADRHQEYSDFGYYLNGIFNGDISLHEAIKECLFQGMARLKYSQGKIQLITYFTEKNLTLDAELHQSDVFIRSKSFQNQPVSLIKNDIIALYNLTYGQGGTYQGRVEISDSDSIQRYQRQIHTYDLNLVASESVATLFVQRQLELYKAPMKSAALKAFISGAFGIEKGDRIEIPYLLGKGKVINGIVAACTHVFGSGKLKRMHGIELTIVDFEDYFVNYLESLVNIRDEFTMSGTVINQDVVSLIDAIALLKPLIISSVDSVNITDDFLGYAIRRIKESSVCSVADVFTFLATRRTLFKDSVKIKDTISFIRSIQKLYTETVAISDEISFPEYKNFLAAYDDTLD